MASFDPQFAINLLEANQLKFGGTPQEREAYLKEAKARLGDRTPEDRREASKLAVETSKMLLTIAVGVLVASFAWMQFARKDGVPWFSLTLTPFYVAAGLLALSMLNGFRGISEIYRRADG